MGIKTRNLDKLCEEKFNVFEYKEVTTYEDLVKYAKENELFTIRFDSEKEIYNLPFYKYNKDLDLKEIYNKAMDINCTLLCSNGYKYDNDLLFNFVIDIDSDNNYILELCSKKVPLRDMYNYDTTIIRGNIFDNKYEVIRENDSIDTKILKKIIDLILENDLKYKYVEGTIYSLDVGIYKKNMVIWQTYK